MRRLLLMLAGALCLPLAACAQAPDDPLTWLGRMATAAQRLDYMGTFSYQSAGSAETSHIVHLVEDGHELERLEVLDGSPREVIRTRGELKCILPEQRTVIVDQPGSRRTFPARLPASFAGLAEHYRIRKGEPMRVAGRETQQIVLEPRDALRYGHQLWADLETGLLLKARLIDETGRLVEQFVFNQVQIGGEIDRARLTPRYTRESDWHVINAQGSQLSQADVGWQPAVPLPGFAAVSSMRRQMGDARGEVLHLVYSDGLASLSVFIEPLGGVPVGEASFSKTGSINIYKRERDGHRITAVGEVPPEALQRMGDAMKRVP